MLERKQNERVDPKKTEVSVKIKHIMSCDHSAVHVQSLQNVMIKKNKEIYVEVITCFCNYKFMSSSYIVNDKNSYNYLQVINVISISV